MFWVSGLKNDLPGGKKSIRNISIGTSSGSDIDSGDPAGIFLFPYGVSLLCNIPIGACGVIFV